MEEMEYMETLRVYYQRFKDEEEGGKIILKLYSLIDTRRWWMYPSKRDENTRRGIITN